MHTAKRQLYNKYYNQLKIVTMENYLIAWYDHKNNIVDCFVVQNCTRENAFAILNRYWNNHEKEGKRYTYTITTKNDLIFQSFNN